MLLIGGKNAKKKSSSSSTKRHFTVVMRNKEHGLYVSSSPSSAARKAVSKLCATDKKKKVQFHIREITQGSKKKTYGPYLGEIEKLAKPIELKGRVIKYKPVAKLSDKKTKTGGAKKRGSVLVVQSKDGKISKKYITKKQADKHMKPRHKRLDKGIKTYHKGGEEIVYAVRSLPHTGLKNLSNMSNQFQISDILSTLHRNLRDSNNINSLKFFYRNQKFNRSEFNEFNKLIKVDSIIECYVNPEEYPNERWFGIVTKINKNGVKLIWFKKNSFNIDENIKDPQEVKFKSIKGILQL
jgi:hypothetical protein